MIYFSREDDRLHFIRQPKSCKIEWMHHDDFFVFFFWRRMYSRLSRASHYQRDILPGRPLQRRHTEHQGLSNHRQLECFFDHMFWLTSKETLNPALLVFVMGIHRWPEDSPHKWPMTRKAIPVMTSSCIVSTAILERLYVILTFILSSTQVTTSHFQFLFP